MKKVTAMTIIVLAMLARDTYAQTVSETRKELAAPSWDKSADTTVTISANYTLSGIGFSINDHDSGSILTWRDITLNGAQINAEFNNAPFFLSKEPFFFNKSNIGVGFHKSFRGYHTDDDANNTENVIHTASTEAILLVLKYEITREENKFIPNLGMDFYYLKLENYNAKPYSTNPDWQHLSGLANKLNIFNFCLYGGMQVKIVEKTFYMNAGGHIGFGPYLSLADWVLRDDFKHPLSFYNLSICFRTGGDLEMGFMLGSFTIFTKAQLVYETGFGYNKFYLSNNENTSSQSTTVDSFRPAFNIGLKVNF